VSGQLTLELEPPVPPDAAFFDADGRPRKLLWCSDTVRIAHRRGEPAECPYTGDRARFMPGGVCCFDVEAGIA
jgi:hypothetical protein